MATKGYKPDTLPSRLSSSGDAGYCTSPGTMSLTMSVKEVGDRLSDLAHQVQALQNERDSLFARNERLKGYHRQLLIECERDVDEGMRRLEDDSDEADYVFVHPEQPESASRFLSNDIRKLGEYLHRQDSSEKVIVSSGKSYHTSPRGVGKEPSLASPVECAELTTENEHLKQRLKEMQARIDELYAQREKARFNYPEAEVSSSEVCHEFSKVEEAVLIRSQSAPEQLLTAHKKIEVLEEIYDHLLAEKKEAESTLEASLKTVCSLTDSLEEEKFEKFGAMGKVKQLTTELEDLKIRVGKKPPQMTGSYLQARSPPPQGEASLMREVKTLRDQLASATEDSAKSKSEADHAHQKRREMKEQLDRTVGEYFLLRDQLGKATEDANCAHQERREMKEALDRTVGEKILLQGEVDRLAKVKDDVDRAHQERREMKERLDRTVAEKLLLEDNVKEQKKKAKDFKMQLDETLCRSIQKDDEIEVLQQRLKGRGK